MTTETQTWLENNILVGFTDKRGDAWWYRGVGDDAGRSNHYAGAIPVQDVRDRLFFWKPVEGDVTTTIVTADGVTTITDPTRKTIVRPDTQEILYVPKKGFTIHDYDLWLIRTNEQITDAATGTDSDSLQISSAGLLKGGGVAWVQYELPDSVETPEGVTFRPFLSSATSLDGSLSSTFQTGAQVIVCDNTLSASLAEKTNRIKIKHSRNSIGRIDEARDALGLVVATSDSFSAQVATLCATEVNDKAWAAFLDAAVALPDKPGRSLTLAENKRDALTTLWKSDPRVSPWTGTAFGVVQAVNTFAHHFATVRGADRGERNAERAITGKVDALDSDTLEVLQRALVATA